MFSGSLYIKQSFLISDIYTYIVCKFLFTVYCDDNCTGCIMAMVGVLASSVVDRGIELQSGQTKDY